MVLDNETITVVVVVIFLLEFSNQPDMTRGFRASRLQTTHEISEKYNVTSNAVDKLISLLVFVAVAAAAAAGGLSTTYCKCLGR